MSQLLDASARGVYAISATPFTDAGDIDWPSVDSLVEFYLQCGVLGLTVLGMMGEAQKLGDQEAAELTRAEQGWSGRGPTVVVTDLGVYHFDDEGKMRLDSLHPGVELARVQEATGWQLRFSDPLPETPAPSAHELHLMREVLDPAGHYRS